MGVLVAMALPTIVVLLIVLGSVELLHARRRRARGEPDARARVSPAGIDALGLAFAPGTRHKKEHDEFVEVDRDDAGDNAPPLSRVDLDAGTARIVVPPVD